MTQLKIDTENTDDPNDDRNPRTLRT